MHLSKIQLLNFKNHQDSVIELVDGINGFFGKNGSGKTNILDAVYYMSMCKSYLNVRDRQNILFNQDYFSINGDWVLKEKSEKIQCIVRDKSKKVFKRNKKEYDRLADHIGMLPVVMISPYDRDLISEGSDLRRKWMDGVISQQDRTYLHALQRYNKCIDHRNTLLRKMNKQRHFDKEGIEPWDVQLVELGNQIFARRKKFVDEFIPSFLAFYEDLGYKKENVSISYKSHLLEEKFSNLLNENQGKDFALQYTSVGTHRDDLKFLINNLPIKKFGSQGQQKSFIIALRLSQYEWIKNHLDLKPVLLLDDIFDKLDKERVGKLIALVANNYFGQVLVTDTDKERLQEVLSQLPIKHLLFNVQDGSVSKN